MDNHPGHPPRALVEISQAKQKKNNVKNYELIFGCFVTKRVVLVMLV